MAKLLAESLHEYRKINSGINEKQKVEKVAQTKIEKWKESISGLKKELAKAKKTGGGGVTLAAKKKTIADIEKKIAAFQKKIDSMNEMLNEGFIENIKISLGGEPKDIEGLKYFIFFASPKLADKPNFIKAIESSSEEELKSVYQQYQQGKKSNKKPVFGVTKSGKLGVGGVNVGKSGTGTNA